MNLLVGITVPIIGLHRKSCHQNQLFYRSIFITMQIKIIDKNERHRWKRFNYSFSYAYLIFSDFDKNHRYSVGSDCIILWIASSGKHSILSLIGAGEISPHYFICRERGGRWPAAELFFVSFDVPIWRLFWVRYLRY